MRKRDATVKKVNVVLPSAVFETISLFYISTLSLRTHPQQVT
jgi:hypothetical protein